MPTSILPAIDIIDGRCVRLSQGDYARCTTYSAVPSDMVKRFIDSGMTRIHVVDLDGAKASAPRNLRTLESLAAVNGAEIEWGGGLKSEQSLRDVFSAGASFAVVGSLAARNPQLMASWIKDYGPDRMVLGADVRHGRISVNGWQEDMELTVDALVKELLPAGLSQVICTEISVDGMLTGPAYTLYADLMGAWPGVIFTASGGVGSMAHIERLALMGVPRVIVGKALYEGHITLKDLERFTLGQRS